MYRAWSVKPERAGAGKKKPNREPGLFRGSQWKKFILKAPRTPGAGHFLEGAGGESREPLKNGADL